MHKRICQLLLLSTFLTGPAFAKEFYIGAGIGSNLNRPPNISTQVRSTEMPWKVYAAWQFTPTWGVELAHHDFGEAHLQFICPAGYLCGAVAVPDRHDSRNGFSFGVIYRYDAGKIDPYVKLGVVRADSLKYIWHGMYRRTVKHTSAMAEVGARIDLSSNFALRFGYEWFDFDPRADGSLALAVEYGF